MTGRIVTIAQQKGGSGKTTLAAHLAVAWTGRGRVALLDVDPQGSLGEWFEARERSLGEDRTGVTFRTASGWGAKREAKALARDHDFVVLDTPPKSDLEARPAIESADLVAVPVQPTPVDLWASGATLDLVARERRPALLVVNRVPPRGLLAEEVIAALAALGPAAAARLGNRIAFAASMGKGRTVLETEAGGKAAAEVAMLADELAARLAGT
ncbi:ParA family partition ATPase [Propylenella binzhouense]|uniref:ParA family protein n=1 Tax=Propylenella binzhouense TaxID=2555902 RepID=A0A964T805_9HYPH|nr:ParA family partition ATPase [Propylenella binzhouense]MYZ49750.1 ParA family protein [Propylenella binzhouense]